MSDSRVGIIILAAGGSIRLGKPKQLLQYEGQSLLRRAVETGLSCECECVVVVLGSHAAELMDEVRGLAVDLVINDDWESGISTSIRAGLAKLAQVAPDVAAAVIMLCDQPFVNDRTILLLLDNYRLGSKSIIAAEYDGVLGVPALFDRKMFTKLSSLEGDAGARVVIRQNIGDKLATVAAPEASFDVDSPEDYERLLTLPQIRLQSHRRD